MLKLSTAMMMLTIAVYAIIGCFDAVASTLFSVLGEIAASGICRQLAPERPSIFAERLPHHAMRAGSVAPCAMAERMELYVAGSRSSWRSSIAGSS